MLLSSSSWCLNTKRNPFSGHFYRSLEAPRLSNCLDVDLDFESRWRLFGHILRRNSEIPANKSMNSYFISHGSKYNGKKRIDIKFGFWDNIQKYNSKKRIDIKLGFWDNVRKYNGEKLLEIKLGFWDNVRKYNGKKRIEIKLGIWDNVRKYNGKKLIEIKLGFWDR